MAPTSRISLRSVRATLPGLNRETHHTPGRWAVTDCPGYFALPNTDFTPSKENAMANPLDQQRLRNELQKNSHQICRFTPQEQPFQRGSNLLKIQAGTPLVDD